MLNSSRIIRWPSINRVRTAACIQWCSQGMAVWLSPHQSSQITFFWACVNNAKYWLYTQLSIFSVTSHFSIHFSHTNVHRLATPLMLLYIHHAQFLHLFKSLRFLFLKYPGYPQIMHKFALWEHFLLRGGTYICSRMPINTHNILSTVTIGKY